MKIVFMGTPDFSVPSLIKLAQSDRIIIEGVVTQPDKPRGRGQTLQPTPIKKTAQELELTVIQEKNVNNPEFLNRLSSINLDAIVVVAFGQKLGSKLLNMPEYGCINLHASLLPLYRGASPIHQAIIDGRKVTGVTTMYMDQGWDTGDMIYKKEVKIKRNDTVGDLHDKLAKIGADLLLKTLIDVKKGTAPREKQNEEKATYASKIDKATGEIDWSQSAEAIFNLVRGVNPWPGAYTYYNNNLLKIWKVEVKKEDINDIKFNCSAAEPGTVLAASNDLGLLINTGKGIVGVKKLQPAGKNPMDINDFLNGYDLNPGEKIVEN